ncbi:MAG: DMT family transporter [Desulfobacterales bacterium]|nr:DMT family transporter [Desulfobacterales bacterium]
MTANTHSLPPGAALATAILCVLFGANAVAIKLSLTGLGTFTCAALRFAMAAVIVAVWARTTGRRLSIKAGYRGHLWIISAGFTLQLALFYLGVSRTDASRATLVANLQPFFILFLAHKFIPDDRITPRKMGGILLGFSGVCLVFMENSGLASMPRTGDAIVLAAAFIWACNAVYVKRVIDHFSAFQLVLFPMLFSVPVFAGLGLLLDRPMIGHISPAVTGSMLYQGLVTASFGFVAWNHLLGKYGAVALHSFIFIMPISGVVLGSLVLGEPISGKLAGAMGLITTGIVVVHWRRKRIVPATPFGRNI